MKYFLWIIQIRTTQFQVKKRERTNGNSVDGNNRLVCANMCRRSIFLSGTTTTSVSVLHILTLHPRFLLWYQYLYVSKMALKSRKKFNLGKSYFLASKSKIHINFNLKFFQMEQLRSSECIAIIFLFSDPCGMTLIVYTPL